MDHDDHLFLKRSLTISGHKTSVSLEKIFWEKLEYISKYNNESIASLVTEVDKTRQGSLSSAIRIFILKNL